MEHKIFLGKYRVPTTKNAAWWEACRSHSGVTYEAEELASGRKAAVELVPAYLLGEIEREELKRVAEAALQIRHPNLPTLYEFGAEGEQFVYVSEYVDGVTAQSWVTARGPMPIATALGLALQVVSVLRRAAQHKIHYPAIYPGNLMLVPDQISEGEGPLVKVLHFPGPRSTSPAFAASNLPLDDATLYASPEEIAGESVDFRSVTYSLGATLWFLLSARIPIARNGRLDEEGAIDPEKIIGKFAGVPKSVGRLLASMLSENRDERPRDPLALEKQILACLSEVDPAAVIQPEPIVPLDRTATPVEPAAWRRFGVKLLATAAAALLAATSLAVLVIPMGFRPARQVDSRVNEKPLNSTATIPADENATFPGAMNFAVAAPSYRRDGGQIGSLEFSRGKTTAPIAPVAAEPRPPAEGPDDPIVEVATQSKLPLPPPPRERQSRKTLRP